MSELYDSIVNSIREFHFGGYSGLDFLDELKEDPDTSEWVERLAANIERDWVNYVDGI